MLEAHGALRGAPASGSERTRSRCSRSRPPTASRKRWDHCRQTACSVREGAAEVAVPLPPVPPRTRRIPARSERNLSCSAVKMQFLKVFFLNWGGNIHKIFRVRCAVQQWAQCVPIHGVARQQLAARRDGSASCPEPALLCMPGSTAGNVVTQDVSVRSVVTAH